MKLRTRWTSAGGLSALMLAAGPLLLSDDAAACGCLSPPVPQPTVRTTEPVSRVTQQTDIAVSQQSEQVIFELEPGFVTAHVLIRYEGNPETFAWLLPVPAVPELGLSSAEAFETLDRFTAPRITSVTTDICPSAKYDCWEPPPPICTTPMPQGVALPASPVDQGFAPEAAEPSPADPGPGQNQPPVVVYNRETVGSYDTVTFGAGDAAAAVDWLNEEGFIVNETMSPFMQPYLDQNMVFVASRLLPGAGVEEIQPLRIRYEGSSAMIPIQLTAIAAEPYMTITSFVFGNTMAQPLGGYLIDVEQDALSVDSFGRSNYPMVLARQFDMATPGAFLREYAGPPPSAQAISCCSPNPAPANPLAGLSVLLHPSTGRPLVDPGTGYLVLIDDATGQLWLYDPVTETLVELSADVPMPDGMDPAEMPTAPLADAGVPTIDAGTPGSSLDAGDGAVPKAPISDAAVPDAAANPDASDVAPGSDDADWCGIAEDGICQCPNADYDAVDCSSNGVIAGPTLINQFRSNYSVLTRLTTRLSPERMLFDPEFVLGDEAAMPAMQQLSGQSFQLSRCVDDIIDSDSYAETDALKDCASLYCGGGLCALTDIGVGCACRDGFVARSYQDSDGKPSITCVPGTPLVDFAAGGLELPSACEGVEVENGTCVDLGGFSTLECDDGYAGVIAAGTSSCAEITRPSETVGAERITAALQELDVCDPAPPQCSSYGYLIPRVQPIPGVECEDNVPDASWLEESPLEPTCEDLQDGTYSATSSTLQDTTEPRDEVIIEMGGIPPTGVTGPSIPLRPSNAADADAGDAEPATRQDSCGCRTLGTRGVPLYGAIALLGLVGLTAARRRRV